MPVFLTTYAQRVDDLLGEYKQASKGKIEIQRLNPEPDSDAEDSARLDGVEGAALRTGERVYLGLSVSMLDQKQAIPFLAPGSRTPARIRHFPRDRSRDDSGKADHRRDEFAASDGQMNPMPMQRGQNGSPPGRSSTSSSGILMSNRSKSRRTKSLTTSSSCWSFIRKRFPRTRSTRSINLSCAVASWSRLSIRSARLIAQRLNQE